MKRVLIPDYEASPRQTLFHLSEAFETLYGGAAGGGKTAAIVAEAVTLCLEHPGISVYIFRRTIPELRDTIVPEIRKQCADFINLGRLTENKVERTWKFDNSSIIRLAYCDHPGDELKYQGVEIQVLLFDELTHFTQDQYEYLKTRVRSSNEDYPLCVMAATNPGSVGHGWVKSYFIDVAGPETIYTDPDTGLTRQFIPATVEDHPSQKFKEDYRKRLSAIQDADLKRALLFGDWDIFSGQVFTEWRRAKHVVEPFQIPDHWPRRMGYDWGFNTFAAALWIAKDPSTNREYIYRELYESQMPVSKQAELIRQLEQGESLNLRLADPSMWKSPANAESGETVSQIFARNGIHFQPANNDRVAGKNAWHEVLAPLPDGLPGLQVFANCLNLIRTLPTLVYDKSRPEDVDTNGEDHLYDAGRYAMMSRQNAKPPTPYKPPHYVRAKARHKVR